MKTKTRGLGRIRSRWSRWGRSA